MNLSADSARNYALPYAEYMSVYEIQDWKRTYQQVYNFAYSSSYLNYSASKAQQAGKIWNERGYCGDDSLISRMKSDYQYYYNYAYSSGGLNYSSEQARRYALDQKHRRLFTVYGPLLLN